MKSKKSLLWLYAVISLVIIVTAVVVSLTAGMSIGTDVGGGIQVEVKLSADSNIKDSVADFKDVLAENGYTAEKVFAEDKYVDQYVVAKISKKDIANQDQFKTSIATKLGVSAEDVTILEFDGTVTNKAVIWTSVGIVCMLLALFVFGWIRYGVVSGLTLTVAPLHSLLMAISLLTLTRLPITMAVIVEVLACVVLVAFATTLLLEKIRENKKMKHNQSLSQEAIVDLSNKETIKPLIFVSVLVLIISLVLVFVPVRLVVFSALSLIICLAVAIFSYYCLAITMQSVMLTMEQATQKARLSRNVSPEPQAQKKTENKSTK